MGIGGIFSAVWRRKWIILAAVITPLLVVGIGMSRVRPTYSATATLRIAVAQNGVASYSEYIYADRLLNTYVKFANSLPVQTELMQRLGLVETPVYLVQTIQTTELLDITAESQDPAMAARIANELAQILVENSDKVFTGAGITALDLIRQEITRVDTNLRQAKLDYQNLVVQSAQSPGMADIDQATKNIDRNQKLYDSLLQQYEQARIDQMFRENAASIENPAVIPTRPDKPNKVLNLALAGVAGLLGGIGLTFLFENLDTRLYSSQQIEEATGNACLLGGVPGVPRKNLFTPSTSSTPLREAFSHVRAHLMLNGRTYIGLKTVLVTSARAREGKSVVTANLAFALAQSGKQVVIVDANMRTPQMHKIFHLPNTSGLSDYLVGNIAAAQAPKTVKAEAAPEAAQEAAPVEMPEAVAIAGGVYETRLIDLPEPVAPEEGGFETRIDFADEMPVRADPEPLVQPTVVPGVFLLSSGPVPSNPSDLISSPKMGDLIRKLSEQYDMVLIDSASLLAFADAAVLTPYVEEVILVVSRKMARESSVRAAAKQLGDVGAKAVHVIVNFAEPNPEYRFYPKYR
jgi:polysaccharide biosynthesis transport protein